MNISSCELVFRRHSIVKTLHSNESKIINSINVKDVQSVEYKTIYITQNRIKKIKNKKVKHKFKKKKNVKSTSVRDMQSVEYKTQSASKIFTALTECEHVTHKRLSLASACSTVTL